MCSWIFQDAMDTEKNPPCSLTYYWYRMLKELILFYTSHKLNNGTRSLKHIIIINHAALDLLNHFCIQEWDKTGNSLFYYFMLLRRNWFPYYVDFFIQLKECKTWPDHPVVSVPMFHFFCSVEVTESIILLGSLTHSTETLTVNNTYLPSNCENITTKPSFLGNCRTLTSGKHRIREGAQAKVLGRCHTKIGNERPTSSPQ